MASVAKWLRQWIVVPPLAGSSPVVRPQGQCSANQALKQASCLFQLPGRQDAHPTPIHPAPK